MKTYLLEAGKAEKLQYKRLWKRSMMYAGMPNSGTFGLNVYTSNGYGGMMSSVVYYPADLSVIGIDGIRLEVVEVTSTHLKLKYDGAAEKE